ncbi:RagB/SusD family nutrient uptake outer membrane protein [Ochrovirga pacifica]|uniref:RagB/SusD family nutrient uptake outer membrane protein n=1 Tax=Ochrovirga pacifica TaxID=1042376 RepID=UPI00031AB9BD|nr:RagB/SusD family nutrient uptake outer membrane protein [Ochrovirga pacifica]
MKRYIKHMVASIIIATTLQSCDDYLEEINPNEVSSELYWRDLEDSNENLTSVYNGLLNQYIWSIDNESLRGDIAFPNLRSRQNAETYAWHAQAFTNNVDNHYFKSWAGMYRVIWRANQVITGLNGMSETFKSQEAWTTQMAEARFLRGLMHFYLHSNYNQGEIIIRDEIPESLEDYSKPTSSSSEVLTFFREDFQYAYDHLPAIQDQPTRVGKGLAAMIYAKSYLYTKEYDKAIPLLKDVIEGPYGYQLVTGDEVKTLFTHAGDFSKETLFELNYTDIHQRLINGGGDSWDEEAYTTRWARYTAPGNKGAGLGGAKYFNPTAWITFEYSNEPMNLNDSRNFKEGNLLRSVPLRCAQMIQVVNDEESSYYGSTPAYEDISFSKDIFSYFKKLTNHDVVSHEEDVLATPWQSGKNVVVYRLADAYLMLAECYIQQNNIPEALSYINAIRERWGLLQLGLDDGSSTYDDVAYDQNSLMEHLMYIERPLELSLEGYAERAIDLRRWGVAKQRFTDLASRDYQVIDYSFTKSDGTAGKGSKVQTGVGPTNDSNSPEIEFNDAAINYIESVHAYLPLPNEETLYNQQVN